MDERTDVGHRIFAAFDLSESLAASTVEMLADDVAAVLEAARALIRELETVASSNSADVVFDSMVDADTVAMHLTAHWSSVRDVLGFDLEV